VVKALASWRGREEMLMDLVQEGTVGLIEAVENFVRPGEWRLACMRFIASGGECSTILKRNPDEANIPGRALFHRFWPRNGRYADGFIHAGGGNRREKFLLDQMHTALNRLPAKERLALSSVLLEEREPRQVASALQITPSHLSRLQKQGIRRVRGMLSRLMGELKK